MSNDKSETGGIRQLTKHGKATGNGQAVAEVPNRFKEGDNHAFC